MLAIRVHNGNHRAGARGKKWQYYVASLFQSRLSRKGHWYWYNTGVRIGPFRSQAKTERLAREWAARTGVPFYPGYGSLYLKPVETDLPANA